MSPTCQPVVSSASGSSPLKAESSKGLWFTFRGPRPGGCLKKLQLLARHPDFSRWFLAGAREKPCPYCGWLRNPFEMHHRSETLVSESIPQGKYLRTLWFPMVSCRGAKWISSIHSMISFKGTPWFISKPVIPYLSHQQVVCCFKRGSLRCPVDFQKESAFDFSKGIRCPSPRKS